MHGFWSGRSSLLRAGLLMPSVFEVSRTVPLGQAIDEIKLIAECSLEGEWAS